MSNLLTPRMFGGVAAGGLALYAISRQFEGGKTPGMRNIEKRHTAAGGGKYNVPAVASKLGDEHDGNGRQLEEKGAGTKRFQESIADQKPQQGKLKQKLNKGMHGAEGGKGQ